MIARRLQTESAINALLGVAVATLIYSLIGQVRVAEGVGGPLAAVGAVLFAPLTLLVAPIVEVVLRHHWTGAIIEYVGLVVPLTLLAYGERPPAVVLTDEAEAPIPAQTIIAATLERAGAVR